MCVHLRQCNATSGGLTRFAATLQHTIAPQLTEQGAYFARYFADGAHPLYDYVVFMLIGSFLGALSVQVEDGRCFGCHSRSARIAPIRALRSAIWVFNLDAWRIGTVDPKQPLG